MPIPHVTPSPTATTSTWQIGSYNAVTDQWTLLLDLNDRATWFVKSYDLPMPEKVVSRSGNPRTNGDRINNERYRNRFITLTLQLRSTTTLAALDTAIHSLEAALDNTPFMLRFAEAQASQYSYAIVKTWNTHIPQDPLQRLAKAKTGITLVLECEPGLLGDKLYLDNLIVNPGFEAPSGPGVQVFADTFANVNAYAVQAGGAPTIPAATTWVDVVTNANLVRFLRLGESSGTTAFDIAGTNQAGTSANCTLGSTALVSGDTGTSYLFNGTSSKVTVPTSGLPTGNAALSMGVGFRISAIPAATAILASYGNATPTTAHQNVVLYITSAGKLQCDVAGSTGTITSAATITTNANHRAEVKWDGTTLTLYLDGASVGTSTPGAQAIPGSPTLMLGANTNSTGFFTGNLQEFAFYSAADTGQSTRWTAFSTGATGTQANTMSLPAAGRVAFGSPAWGAYNTWQVRFRFVTAQVPIFYLHFTDASNYLAVDYGVTAGTLRIVQVVSGSTNVVASAAVVLTHEAWYWLQVTQFPITVGNPPMVQASLFYDDAGVIGSAVTSGALGPATPPNGLSSYFIGRPQIAVTGAALVVGGNSGGVHTVALFGPGGWDKAGFSGTGPIILAWDQNTSNTYPGGPVTSYGAARIDLPPAGTADARWETWDGTGGATGAAQFGIPTAQNHVLGFSLAYKTTAGLSATSAVKVMFRESDSSGTELITGTQTILNGTTSTSWAVYSGTYTPSQAGTAYVRIQLQVLDTTANSANATVWFDNVQLWDQTALGGQTSMPYCELRFPQSPASLMVSGLVGDVAAPALISSGSFVSSLPSGSTLQLLLGRRAMAHASAYLVGYPHSYVGAAGYVAVLDSSSYGGYYWRTATGQTSDTGPLATFGPSALTSDMLYGIYNLLERAKSSQSVGNLPNITSQGKVITFTGSNTASVVYDSIYGQFAASNTWTQIAHGHVFVPPYGVGGRGDPTQISLSFRALWADSTGGGSQFSYGVQALLPIDGETLNAVYAWPSSMAPQSNKWVYIYADGTNQVLNGPGGFGGISGTAAWGWSQNSNALATPTTQLGGVGTVGTANASVTPVAHSLLQLDPNAGDSAGNITGAAGVNQMLASVVDNSGNILGVSASLEYFPLYLDPR